MRRFQSRILAAALCLPWCLAFIPVAVAETGDASLEYIEEVIVTARKREEKLADVPIAATALNVADLDRYQVTDLGGLRNIVPNLSVNIGDAANAIVYIRGIGQRDSLSFADPGVGVYLDDVYLGRAQGAFMDVIDVQRIEVLRGPQGTLYGRNTVGGAIKYVSVAPSDERFLSLDFGVGNYGDTFAKAVVNGALDDAGRAAGRVSVAFNANDGYAENVDPDASDTDGDKDSFAWRAQLRYAASDRLSFNVTLDQSVNDPDRSMTPARVTGGPVLVDATSAYLASDDPFAVEADFNDVERLETSGVSLTVNYELETLTLKSITALRGVEHETHIDLDGTKYSIFGVLVDQDQEQFSQELQLLYDAGGQARGVAGLYWFSEDDVTRDGIRGTEPYPIFTTAYNTVSENDQSLDAFAAFGEYAVALTPELELSVGLRYTRESKALKRKACQAFSDAELDIAACNPASGATNPFALNLDLEEDFDALTPKLGISYNSADTGLIYLSWARGFKSGGFDGRIGYNGASGDSAVSAQARPYDAETVDALEVGWKTGTEDGRLRIAAAAFFNDYQDLQVSSFSATPGGGFATVFTNAGEAEIRGLEVEVLARFDARWLASLSAGYLDADYDEYINSAMEDVSGDLTPINSPEWTAHLGLSYEQPLDFASLRITVDAGYRGGYFVDVGNLGALRQDAYTTWNAAVALTGVNDNWHVSAGTRNFSDEEYITHGFDLTSFPGVGLAYYGVPRTWRITAGYRFE